MCGHSYTLVSGLTHLSVLVSVHNTRSHAPVHSTPRSINQACTHAFTLQAHVLTYSYCSIRRHRHLSTLIYTRSLVWSRMLSHFRTRSFTDEQLPIMKHVNAGHTQANLLDIRICMFPYSYVQCLPRQNTCIGRRFTGYVNCTTRGAANTHTHTLSPYTFYIKSGNLPLRLFDTLTQRLFDWRALFVHTFIRHTFIYRHG